MKTRFIALLISFAAIVSFAQRSAAAECPESGLTTVFYVNGVWNLSEEDADDARRTLSVLATQSFTNDWPTIDYVTEYNPSDGYIGDLIESADQALSGTNWTNFWRFAYGLDPAPLWFRLLSTKLIGAYSSILKINFQPVLDNQIKDYKGAISKGRKVVVVAHSQGNFFANEAVKQLSVAELRSFAIVSVANPDSLVATNVAPHIIVPPVTLVEDLIVESVSAVRLLEGLAPAMAPTTTNLPATSADWSGHEFIATYLQGSYPAWQRNSSRTKIIDHLVAAVRGIEIPNACSPQTGTSSLVASGFNLIDAIASDGTYIYVGTHDGKLFRMSKTGTDVRNIATVPGFIGQILFNNGSIWFYGNTTNFGGATIYVMPQDLSAGPTPFLSGVVKSMGITGSTLYYWDGDNVVKSIPLAGGTPEPLLPGNIFGFAVDGTSIFMQVDGFLGVSRLDTVTKTVSSSIPQATGSTNVFVDANNVYAGVSEISGLVVQDIYKAPKQGGTAVPLVDSVLPPGQYRGGLLSDGNFVYYIEGPGGAGLTSTLKAVPVGGGTPFPLSSTLISARYMINVNGTLYWSTAADAPGAGAIYRLAR